MRWRSVSISAINSLAACCTFGASAEYANDSPVCLICRCRTPTQYADFKSVSVGRICPMQVSGTKITARLPSENFIGDPFFPVSVAAGGATTARDAARCYLRSPGKVSSATDRPSRWHRLWREPSAARRKNKAPGELAANPGRRMAPTQRKTFPGCSIRCPSLVRAPSATPDSRKALRNQAFFVVFEHRKSRRGAPCGVPRRRAANVCAAARSAANATIASS